MKEDQQKENSLSFRGHHSGAKRIWHWTSSLAIMALLITVLLASTLLKPRNNIAVIQQNLEEKGVSVTKDQAKGVAKAIGEEIWVWHKYIGITLAFLLLFRIILEFFEPQGESLKRRIKKGALYLRQVKPGGRQARHYMFVKYFYVLFYLIVLTLVVTGIGIIYSDDSTFLKGIKENWKDIHSICMYGIIGFIILHIGGLLRSELGEYPGISSDMIHGGRNQKDINS
ncbi:MAG TPA: cytochrome b/b6 domain-containing protein [Bacteroidia bacterium]|jgi:cytochrome b561|nr:cytochrome b/b6 domain-containing protein [Bacteroidia bacterium]